MFYLHKYEAFNQYLGNCRLVEEALYVKRADWNAHVVIGDSCTRAPSRVRVLNSRYSLVKLGSSLSEWTRQQAYFITDHLPHHVVRQ